MVYGIIKPATVTHLYARLILIWHVMLWCQNFETKPCPCVFVFLFLRMWKNIWKQSFFVNMSIILIVAIIG